VPCSGERAYKVDDVNFKITFAGTEQLVRGSGEYTWSPTLGPLDVLAHRLRLELTIGGGPIQIFDSELIAGASDGVFPPISIVIDKNNQVCTDEVLTISATPVAENEILKYCLTRDSSAEEGCFPPCLCPIMLRGQLAGSFALVKLPPLGPVLGLRPTFTEYAVIRVRWNVISPVGVTTDSLTGSGFYSVLQPSLIEGIERATLALTPAGEQENIWRSVRSVFVFTPQPPGSIDMDLSRNGFYCFDEAFFVRSVRCRTIVPGGLALDDDDTPMPVDHSPRELEPALESSGSR
jgi:hypothetical protein